MSFGFAIWAYATFFKIDKFICEFRCIKENDISIEYINGLNKDNRNIQNVQKVTTKLSQKKYIKLYVKIS